MRKEDRNKKIIELYENTLNTKKDLSKKFLISRERIRQIVLKISKNNDPISPNIKGYSINWKILSGLRESMDITLDEVSKNMGRTDIKSSTIRLISMGNPNYLKTKTAYLFVLSLLELIDKRLSQDIVAADIIPKIIRRK